jgi:Eukaryotic aspartyl protease
MHFSAALIALVAGTTVAAPSMLKHHKRSFNVNRVAVGPANRNVVTAMKKAFNKYQMEIPEGLAAADEEAWAQIKCATSTPSPTTTPAFAAVTGVRALYPTGTGTAGTNPNGKVGNATNTPTGNDVEYNALVNIGGQPLMMDFDTGSSDLWVFSSLLPQEQQAGHQNFNPFKSPTFKLMQGASFAVHYGDKSSASGNVVGTDNVAIGGATATGQAVEVATAVTDEFTENKASNGLVGLAFSKLNTIKPKGMTTFLDTIQKDLAQPIMAANLKHGTPGSYAFGQVDPSAFKGQLANTPVDSSSGFWQFNSTRFVVGNQPPQNNPNPAPAIADTGTTLLVVDDVVAQAYWEQVPGAQQAASGSWVFPCSSPLPDLQLAVGPSYMARIPGALMNFGQTNAVGGGDNVVVGGARRRYARQSKSTNSKRDFIIEVGVGDAPQPAQGGQMCSGGLQSNHGGGKQIFGDVMFKAQYVVFNMGDASLSMAQHA